MKTLLRKAPSLNTYEGMYDRLSSKASFNHDEWIYAANEGTLDMYAAGIDKFESLGIDYQKYKDDLNLSFADTKTRMTALYNEVYADREKQKERERTVTDENGVSRIEKYLASDYDYNKELIKSQNDYREEVERQRIADEAKDSAGFLENLGWGTLGLLTGLSQGFLNGINQLQSLIQAGTGWIVTGGKTDFAKDVAMWQDDNFLGDLSRSIAEFETKYSTLRYSNGDYTNLGKYIGGASTSIGEMIPSMLIGRNVGGVLGEAGVSASTATKVAAGTAQATFYAGMFSGNVGDMYKQFAIMGADVDSASIVANAAIKSALQWGVEKTLGKILGATSIDNLVFGRAQNPVGAKIGGWKAVGHILKDAGQEGLEEVLQDTSDFLVNEGFSNFIDAYGVNNEISFQSLLDAFIIGAMVSVAGSAVDVIKTRRVIGGDGKKLGKLASWEYGINMDTFAKNISEVMDKAGKVNYETDNRKKDLIQGAALEAYASYRLVTSIYQEIGDERFKAANEVLDKITEQIESGKFSKEDVTSYVDNMREQFGHLSNLALEKMVSELKKKNVKEVKRTIKADDKKATEKGADTKEKLTPKQARDKLEELFEESGAKTVTETDGNVEVEKDDNIVISSDRLNNESINEILQNLSVQKLVSHLSELSNKEHIRDNLSDIYEEYYGKKADEDADIISLLFDADFFKAVLMESNKDVFKYLSYFAEAEKELVRGKRRDEIYRNKINEIRNHWFEHLADYCIIHEEANPTMFLNYISDAKKRKEIENKVKKGRWGTDIYNRVLLSESNLDKLWENEKVVLKKRFDNAFPKNIATRHWNNVNSNNAKARQQSMNALSTKYKGLFSSKYDGVTYMPDTSIGNRVFNKFMQSLGLDLSTLLNKNYLTESDVKLITDDYGKVDENSIFNFRKAQFKEMSTVYDFSINRHGHFEVTHNGKIVGFSKYRKLQKDIEEGKKADTFVTDTKVKSDRLSKLINTDLITTSASYYTIDDVITNPELLKPEVANEIVKFANDKYGLKLTRPTADTTFLYLRNYFLSEFKDMTIVMSNDGEFVFASVKKIVDLFKNPKVKITKDTKLSDIIKDKYLPEGLNLKIVEGWDGAKYVPYKNIEKDGATVTVLDNTIYLGDGIFVDGDDYVRFVFAHEFQHALQFMNNINAGVSNTWLDYCDKKQRKEIIADIRKHKPELFKGVKEGSQIESRIANDFVYHSTGETDAYGLQGNDILDFIPVVSKNDKNVLTFIMPWGTVHKIKNVKKADVISSIWKTETSLAELESLYDMSLKRTTKKYLKEDDPRAKDFRATPARQNAGYTERYYVLNEDGTQKLDKQGKPIYKYIYPKKESRYVSKNKYAGTNLQYFVKSYSPTLMSPELQKFILNAKDLDPVLQNKIDGKEKGTLTQKYVFDYLRSKTKIDDNTFKQINDAFFQNKYIKTFDELQHKIDHSMRESWAIYRMFKLDEKLKRNIVLLETDGVDFDYVYELIERNEYYAKMYANLLVEFDEYNKKSFEVEDSYARMRYMRHYDGTIKSEREVSSVVRLIAMLNWNTTKKTNEFDITDAYADVVESLDLSKTEMIEAIQSREASKWVKEGRSYEDVLEDITELGEKLYGMSVDEIRKLYTDKNNTVENVMIEGLVADADGNYLYISPGTPKMTSSHLVNRMKGKVNSLKRILTPKEIAKIVEDNSDIFGKDLSVNNELYQNKIRNKTRDGYHYENKSVEEVQEVFDKVAEICDRVREEKRIGKANVDARDKQIKELQRKIKQLERDKKNQKADKIPKVYEIILEDERVEIEYNKEIPNALRKILQVHYSKTSKSKVQNLSTGNERHIRVSGTLFYEENADNFNNLTQNDVDEIIDFYLTTDVPFNDATAAYRTAMIWTLTYIVEMGRKGNINFVIDANTLDKVEKHLRQTVSRASIDLRAWNTALKRLNPEAIIANSIARKTGIDIPQADINRLVKAVESRDMGKVEKVKQEIYESLLAKSNRKRDVLDKLLQYERLAMLSGPGTWLRNLTSNVLVMGVNRLSDGMNGKLEKVLNKLFPKSQYIESQYKISGTKVTKQVSDYIETNLIKNGLLDKVISSLNKYDVRKSTTGKSNDIVLASMIADSVCREFSHQPLFNDKVFSEVEKFILKMISDDWFVIKAAKGYLGKMITEDLETGKIKSPTEFFTQNGISKEFMTYVAEAFKLASYDYMHKPNIIFDFESKLAKKSKGAYFAYKQIFPFVGASWNWFVEGLKYSPVGLAKAIVNYAKLENTIEKYERKRQTFAHGDVGVSSDFAKYLTQRDITKGIIGTVGFIIGALLAGFGVAKLDEEDYKYKLYFGKDKNVVIDVSDVYGTQGIFLGMSLTSTLIDSLSDRDGVFDDILDITSATLDQMFIDSTFADFFNTFRYSQNLGDWLTYQPVNVANMFVPNFLKTLTSLFTPHKINYGTGFLGKVGRLATSVFPFLPYLFPTYYDPYTGEKQIPQKLWLLTSLATKLTPIDLSICNISDMERIAIQEGVHKSQLTGRYKINDEDVKLSMKQIKTLNEFYGQINSAELKELQSNSRTYKVKQANGTFKNLRWSQMTDKEKATVIDRIMTDNSGYAKIYILTDSGEYKYFATDAEFKALRALGITKNVYRKNNKQSGFVKVS